MEIVRPDFAWQAAASLYLDAAGMRRLEALPAARRPAAFLRFWTSLEAFAKASGHGIVSCPQGTGEGRDILGRIPDLTRDFTLAPAGWSWALRSETLANAQVLVAVTRG